jgi:hypothetical protein
MDTPGIRIVFTGAFTRRIGVAIMRVLGLAVSLGFGLANSCLAEAKPPTSLDVETKFLVGPFVMDLLIAGKVQPRCIAAVTVKASGDPAIGVALARNEGECPTDIASYFEKSDINSQNARESTFDDSKTFNVRVVEGRSRLLYSHPVATSYSFLNPTTGKEEFEAYCTTFTYLDPRVHKGDPDLKMIHYKRTPTQKPLTSLDAEVTCGDINAAYENEIKTRAPKPRQLLVDDTVRHNTLAGRGAKVPVTPTADRSNHQRE